MKFGNIELSEVFGGLELVNIPANSLLQEVAAAVATANSNPLLGATYNPIWYVGKQVVNGINYAFIAEDIRTTKNKDKSIVGLIINVPLNGTAKVDRIIESTELAPEVQTAFTTVEKSLYGTSFKPIIYLGKQTVKGVNHYIICEAKAIYPNAEPYAVIFVFNIFEGKPSVVGILPIKPVEKDTPMLCGYSFTW